MKLKMIISYISFDFKEFFVPTMGHYRQSCLIGGCLLCVLTRKKMIDAKKLRKYTNWRAFLAFVLILSPPF